MYYRFTENNAGNTMSENSQHLLKETVFRLLGFSQHQNDYFNELLSLKNVPEEENLLSGVTELGYLPLLKENSNNETGQIHSSDDCVRKLISLSSITQGQKLSLQQKDELYTVTKILKTIKSQGGLYGSSITKTLSTECSCHLEVWITLHKHGVVPLQHFISINQRRDDFIPVCTKQIVDFGKTGGNTELISDILSEFITVGYSTPDDSESFGACTKSCVTVLDHLVRDILQQLLKADFSEVEAVIEAFCKLSVSLDIQKLFYSHTFSVIMGYRPEMKVSKAIKEQSNWVYGKISEGLVMLYRQILFVLDVSDVISHVRQILEQHEVNWQLLLSFISVITVLLQESQAHLLEFTDSLLREGLEDCDLEMTFTGLLIARQACSQGPHVFMSYADWFQRTFSDSSRSFANSRKSFTFLIKLLTDLAPYESAQHIKVHILRPPYVPGKCRQILNDYIMLAKTRLQDLEEPLDTQKTSDGTEQSKSSDSFTEEVNSAVEAFKTSGKIPTSILEASIFRKPYYIGQFLPVLLKPRPLPDFPDTKMKLIAALKKADKIPQAMYQNYEKDCKKEAMELLQDVFVDLDSDDDMELSPLEQLENSLQHLTTFVQASHQIDDKPKYTLKEVVTVIAGKVEACLSDVPVNQIDQQPIEININDITIPGKCGQVVDMILNKISETLQTGLTVGNFDFVWLTKLMEALISYSRFMDTLFKRMVVLLVNQGTSLQDHHINTLAAILVEIHMLKVSTPSILQCSCMTSDCESILEFITLHLSTQTGEQMSLTLRFVSSCLKYVYSSHLEENRFYSVPCLTKKFVYLSNRLVRECRHGYGGIDDRQDDGDLKDLVKLLYQSEFVKNLAESTKFSFQDWLRHELQVDVGNDLLNDFERYEYYQWIIHQHYRRQTDGGFDSYMDAASIIIQTVITTEYRDGEIWRECSINKRNNLRKGAELGLVQQLAGIVQLFKETESQDTRLPWLPNQLNEILEQTDSHISRQCIVLQFTRLLANLPPYLMFSDTAQNLTASSQLQGSLDFLNSIFITYLSEGLVLPVSLTIHVAQGLFQAIKPGHHHIVTELVLESCPALVIAFVIHFKVAAPFLDLLMTNASSELQRLFTCLRDDSDCTSESPWLKSCYIFSKILNVYKSQHSFDMTILKLKDQVLVTVTEMLFIQLTYLQHYAQVKNEWQITQIVSGLKKILTKNMEMGVLDVVLQGDFSDQILKCTGSHVLQLYPVTVLRFLREEGMHSIGSHVDREGFNGLLKCYTSMCKLYEEEKTAQSNKVIVTSEVSQTCQYLVHVIENTPVDVLKSTNQDVLMECGPLLYDAVLHQI